jgi:2-polyprenyl-6-methoxyphenol hydroxylase-like FAD-dependent oxidoreductase
MSELRYDLVIVGGGLAGASLGLNMAREGAKVLILDREAKFRDRVRGDAAGASDPTYGCGLAVALRDVRLLRDHLLAEPDWTLAADRYAVAHDRAFSALKCITDWFIEINFSTGPAADAMRARSTPLRAADSSRSPDLHGHGPDAPSDEHARMRYYGLN